MLELLDEYEARFLIARVQ